MQEEPPSVVVVPVDVLQSLLQEVRQLRDRVEALEGHADGFDSWMGSYSEAKRDFEESWRLSDFQAATEGP